MDGVSSSSALHKSPIKTSSFGARFLKEKIKSLKLKFLKSQKPWIILIQTQAKSLRISVHPRKIWIEDSLPAGAKPQGNEGDKSWRFVKKSDEHPSK